MGGSGALHHAPRLHPVAGEQQYDVEAFSMHTLRNTPSVKGAAQSPAQWGKGGVFHVRLHQAGIADAGGFAKTVAWTFVTGTTAHGRSRKLRIR